MNSRIKLDLNVIYDRLLNDYGRQGWWPLFNRKEDKFEYHPGDYVLPETNEQKFEICMGAILTQNTGWKNAEKALLRLIKSNKLSPESILDLNKDNLAELIRSSGYYNQKAMKIIAFSEFFITEFNSLASLDIGKARDRLLSLKGIGKETADSILLYSLKRPIFVIDTYTKRLLLSHGLEFKGYDDYQEFFHKNLDPNADLFNEFHALIVAWAKANSKLY